MPYGLLDTGFNAKPLDVIEAEMKADLRDAISPTLNLSSRALLGQFVGVVASQLRQLWEAEQAKYAAFDRRQARGVALDILGAYTGTSRDPATPSTAVLNVTLAAGTYPAGVLRVYRTGDATVIFTNDSAVTSPGGLVSNVAFTCTQTGPTSAPAGTLVNIATPYAGFSLPVTNPLSATPGQEVELDSAYRLRQIEELQKGTASVDAIRSALLANDNVTYAIVLSNNTDATDSDLTPLRAIQPIVEGGSNAEVAQIIFDRKAAGIRSYGAINVSVYDQQGNQHLIGITRPTTVTYEARVTYKWLSSAFVSVADANYAIENNLQFNFDLVQRPGVDIINSTYVASLRSLPGIIDCQVEFRLSPSGPYLSSNIVITPTLRALWGGVVSFVPTMVHGIP